MGFSGHHRSPIIDNLLPQIPRPLLSLVPPVTLPAPSCQYPTTAATLENWSEKSRIVRKDQRCGGDTDQAGAHHDPRRSKANL